MVNYWIRCYLRELLAALVTDQKQSGVPRAVLKDDQIILPERKLSLFGCSPTKSPSRAIQVLTAHLCWALACTNYTYLLHQPSTLSCTVTVNDYWGGGLARSWRTLLYSTLLNSTAAAAALPAKQPTQLTHRQRDSSVVFAINGTAYNFWVFIVMVLRDNITSSSLALISCTRASSSSSSFTKAQQDSV